MKFQRWIWFLWYRKWPGAVLSSSLAAKYRLTDRIMINKRTRRTNYWRCDSVMTSVWRLLWNPYDTISDNFHWNPVRPSRQSKKSNIRCTKLEWENIAFINVVLSQNNLDARMLKLAGWSKTVVPGMLHYTMAFGNCSTFDWEFDRSRVKHLAKGTRPR